VHLQGVSCIVSLCTALLLHIKPGSVAAMSRDMIKEALCRTRPLYTKCPVMLFIYFFIIFFKFFFIFFSLSLSDIHEEEHLWPAVT
jgi:hypothetical protein